MCRLPIAAIAVMLLGLRASAEKVEYVRDVRPILREHCYQCHGPSSQRSGLRLDVKSAAFDGGDFYSSAIVPGDPDASPLYRFVALDDADLRMPPDGEALSPHAVSTLRRWIAAGAEWPDGVDAAVIEDRRDHWAFRPIGQPAPPAVVDHGWAQNGLDRFVLARLERNGLEPSPEAARSEWLSRVSLDLVGLPPTPRQTRAFLGDRSPSAYRRVVDALLASPRYGERWAQHWLDVVRYADTHGFEVNTERPNAWPYRDYVITAFNRDTPYDDFIRAQIVGDAIGEGAATGFLVTASVLLPGQIGKDAASKRLARQDSLDEIVNNIGQSFLGLSIGCARCHDHKFDPISQRDYYAMQAFVAGVHYEDRELGASEFERLRTRIKEGTDKLTVFAGTFRQPDDIQLLRRGDPEQPVKPVGPSVPDVLGSAGLPRDAAEQERRRALADWVADPANPLTAHVIVNRIWQGHFGMGLVETSNDFGRNGARPSHPQLLDWLASEFVRSGWSIKKLHRRIVLSATYRQSSGFRKDAAAVDATARFLWRYPSRRMEAEAIRDSILLTSGELNRVMGGPGFDLFDKRGGLTGFDPVESFSADGLRRMIYAHKVRREPDAVFGAFDCPDAGQSMPRRRESNTPIQALNLLNSTFVLERARAMSDRISREAGNAPGAQIRRAYWLALSREPTRAEITDAEPVVREYGLQLLCRVLVNSNEFLMIP